MEYLKSWKLHLRSFCPFIHLSGVESAWNRFQLLLFWCPEIAKRTTKRCLKPSNACEKIAIDTALWTATQRVPWCYSSRMFFPLVLVYMAEDTKHWPGPNPQVVQAVHDIVIPASTAHTSRLWEFGNEGYNTHVNSAGGIHFLVLDWTLESEEIECVWSSSPDKQWCRVVAWDAQQARERRKPLFLPVGAFTS